MTTEDKIARRKLSLLELASELNDVSRACRIRGYSPHGRPGGFAYASIKSRLRSQPTVRSIASAICFGWLR